jgi:hypothetical protein
MAEASANIEAAHAKKRQPAHCSVLDRQQNLYSIGWTVKSSVKPSKLTAGLPHGWTEPRRRSRSGHASASHFSAARDGTFLQDAYNDAAYSQQRAPTSCGRVSPSWKPIIAAAEPVAEFARKTMPSKLKMIALRSKCCFQADGFHSFAGRRYRLE